MDVLYVNGAVCDGIVTRVLISEQTSSTCVSSEET